MKNKWIKSIGLTLAVVIFLCFMIFIGPFMLSIAWNYTMPYIFGLPFITIYHAFWLLILIWMLAALWNNMKLNF